MTRKDFVLIAAALSRARPVSDEAYILAEHDKVARTVAAALRSTNPAFDTSRFLRAAGCAEC